MIRPLIYRQNRLFRINEKVLPDSAKNLETMNSLYLALFLEFQGAEYNDKYSKMNYQERMNQVNEYANLWLDKKGHR